MLSSIFLTVTVVKVQWVMVLRYSVEMLFILEMRYGRYVM